MSATEEKLTIWITGSAGFLGTRLVNNFRAAGHSVMGISRRESATTSVTIDLSASHAVERLRTLSHDAGLPAIVIHCASKQPGSGDWFDFVRSNVRTTLSLAEALRDQPPQQIIYTSTQSVYARPARLPVKEIDPAGGATPYSATKRWGEQILQALADVTRVTVLRLPSLYGAGQADSFVDGLARQALRDEPIELFSRGELIRDALHVTDVVEAIATCAGKLFERSFAVLNLGCGRRIKTFEYATTLVKALQSQSEIIPIDRLASQTDLYADIEQARRMIGFAPKSLEESLRVYANELSA